MDVELQINNSIKPEARFVTWSPCPCRIRVTNPAGTNTPTVSVKITGVSAAGGGAVVFRSGTTGAFTNTVTLTVPVDGTSVPFFTAGKFGQPSVNNGDVKIEARVGTTLVGSVPVMVRIRKNANNLTTGERDRFIAAFAKLNNQGSGDSQISTTCTRRPAIRRRMPRPDSCPGIAPIYSTWSADFRPSIRA
jgi:tyrosinase